MSQMTPSQARVIDPILSAVARGYESQNAAVANALFPVVPVAVRAGTLIEFGKEAFDVIDSRRAPGAHTKQVQTGYGKSTFSLVDHRLEGLVPVELLDEASAVPGIDLMEVAIRRVQDQMALERENDAATLARNAANYPTGHKDTLSGTAQWSHVDSNPFVAIDAAKDAVRKKIGKRPNVLVLGPDVLSTLRNHLKVLDRLSTATDRTPATIAQLQALFEVESIIEGEAVKNGASGFDDVWGNDAILAYVAPKSLREMGSQSYGYTYQLVDRPVVEQAYLDRNRNSWAVPVADARKPYLVGATGGYLFKAAVA